MVRAVMRLMLFRSGRARGHPRQVGPAERGGARGLDGGSAPIATAGEGRPGAPPQQPRRPPPPPPPPPPPRPRLPHRPASPPSIKEAQARFARTLALEMAQIDLLRRLGGREGEDDAAAAAAAARRQQRRRQQRQQPEGRRPRRQEASPHRAPRAPTCSAPCSRRGSSRHQGPRGPRRPAPQRAGRRARRAALVRLDSGGAGTPAATSGRSWPTWGSPSPLLVCWLLLPLPLPPRQTQRGRQGRAPPNVPGIGNPADAISAASTLACSSRNATSATSRASPRWSTRLGEAALGADGRCSGIDEFITAMFETADPAQAIEAL